MLLEKNFLLQFEDVQKKEIGSSPLVFLISKDEVEMDEPLSHSPETLKSELLTIVGDPEVGEPCMFLNCMYFSVFYLLCYEMNIPTDIPEYQILEERDPDR